MGDAQLLADVVNKHDNHNFQSSQEAKLQSDIIVEDSIEVVMGDGPRSPSETPMAILWTQQRQNQKQQQKSKQKISPYGIKRHHDELHQPTGSMKVTTNLSAGSTIQILDSTALEKPDFSDEKTARVVSTERNDSAGVLSATLPLFLASDKYNIHNNVESKRNKHGHDIVDLDDILLLPKDNKLYIDFENWVKSRSHATKGEESYFLFCVDVGKYKQECLRIDGKGNAGDVGGKIVNDYLLGNNKDFVSGIGQSVVISRTVDNFYDLSESGKLTEDLFDDVMRLAKDKLNTSGVVSSFLNETKLITTKSKSKNKKKNEYDYKNDKENEIDIETEIKEIEHVNKDDDDDEDDADDDKKDGGQIQMNDVQIVKSQNKEKIIDIGQLFIRKEKNGVNNDYNLCKNYIETEMKNEYKYFQFCGQVSDFHKLFEENTTKKNEKMSYDLNVKIKDMGAYIVETFLITSNDKDDLYLENIDNELRNQVLNNYYQLLESSNESELPFTLFDLCQQVSCKDNHFSVFLGVLLLFLCF